MKQRKRPLWSALVIWLIPCAVLGEVRNSLDGSFAGLRDSGPRANRIGGGFTTLFAGLALNRGWEILRDPEASRSEKNVGRALLAVNVVRFGDGVLRLLATPASLSDAAEYERGVLANPQHSLLQHAQRFRRLRYWRAHLLLLTAFAYLHLGTSGRDSYTELRGTGAFLVALAAFQYRRHSPEEVAAREYFGPGEVPGAWQFRAGPGQVEVAWVLPSPVESGKTTRRTSSK